MTDDTPGTRHMEAVRAFVDVGPLQVARYGKRIVSVDRVATIFCKQQAAKGAIDWELETLYAVAGETGKCDKGVWLIRWGERNRLI